MPFVRSVRAGRVVYGLHRGEFFAEEFESETEWEAAQIAYEKRLEEEIDPKTGKW